ncbi:MAG: hypothetical protein GC151_11300 [Betaproteobacteria bacterium]|nr:hypothetical protein [Betaproteobacteria bacterium]
MRVVLAILIVANVALAAFGLVVWNQHRQPGAVPADPEVNADQIRIVRGEPEPVAPPPPAPAAPAVCLRIGPLSGDEVAQVRKSLAPIDASGRLSVAPMSAAAEWWVYVPPKRTRTLAEREVARLKALGIDEHYVVQDDSDMRFAISLGIFRTRDSAERFANRMRSRGVRNVVVGTRGQQIELSAVFVTAPTDADTARVVEVKADYPGAEVRPVPCPDE